MTSGLHFLWVLVSPDCCTLRLWDYISVVHTFSRAARRGPKNIQNCSLSFLRLHPLSLFYWHKLSPAFYLSQVKALAAEKSTFSSLAGNLKVWALKQTGFSTGLQPTQLLHCPISSSSALPLLQAFLFPHVSTQAFSSLVSQLSWWKESFQHSLLISWRPPCIPCPSLLCPVFFWRPISHKVLGLTWNRTGPCLISSLP